MNVPAHGAQASATEDAAQQARALITGYWATRACHAAVELRLPDHLAGGAVGLDELSTRTGAHPPTVLRLLRALAVYGVVQILPDGRFAPTAVSGVLRAQVPGSLREFALMFGDALHAQVWQRLADSVRTGRPAFELVHGCTLFDYLSRHPDDAEVFDDAMQCGSALLAAQLKDAVDFSRFGCVVDVAGGYGGLLAPLLAAHPSLHGILFDLPHVTAGARTRLRSLVDRGRCEIVTGSFFEQVPAGGDAYLLKNILHDWDDGHCLVVLRNIHAQMHEDSVLLVFERLLGEATAPGQAALVDLEMLTMTPGGRERSLDEYRALLGEAGLGIRSVVPTPMGICAIETAPEGSL